MKVSPTRLGWLLPAALSSVLFGCPNQELAPLTPCTVSGVSVEVPQSGVDKVDLLFMIDNSGSMAEEQKKLGDVLGQMVEVLTTGYANPATAMPGQKVDFPPVKSLHIGVISSDMGVNGAVAQKSCGERSYSPTEREPITTTTFQVKPKGDDGVLQTSVAVAVNGIWTQPSSGGMPTQVVAGDPTCEGITFPPGELFINFTADQTNVQETARKFRCIAKLGKNGCGLEQQLEASLKALTPPDSPTIKFSGAYSNGVPTTGHGNSIDPSKVSGLNRGFLREDSILAVVFVSDEEDCSIPDSGAAIFNVDDTSVAGTINVRCGLPQNQNRLHPVKRYVDGLQLLKPEAYRDRLIVASIVGTPLAVNLGNIAKDGVVSGKDAINALLANPEMEFKVVPNAQGNDSPKPACISAKGDGDAAPARRFLELTREFGENGVVTSICEDTYLPALSVITQKIAAQLTGACLPRRLSANPETGEVLCDVVEIKAAGSQIPCDPANGRKGELPSRNGRRVCLMNQVPGGDEAKGQGWYYDETSDAVKESCPNSPQRISFTSRANPDPGSQAKFECFQPVAKAVNEDNDKNEDAVGLSCRPDNSGGPQGDAKCDLREQDGFDLICVLGSCQKACTRGSECPDGWLCQQNPVDGRGFCVNPTCPPSL